MRTFVRIMAAAALLALWPGLATAQGTSTISGVVKDPSGAVLHGVTVEAGLVNHPGCTLGYRLTVHGTVLTYTTDNEPFGDAAASQHLAHPADHVALAREADLLIQDAQYTPEEYAHRVGWGHSTYLDALQLAQQAQAKRLVLFHHDPSHTDAEVDRMVAQCGAESAQRGLTLECLGAAEGQVL